MRISRREFVAGATAMAAGGTLQAANTQKDLMTFDSAARALVAKMTLEEKAGQMAQPDVSFLRTPEWI